MYPDQNVPGCELHCRIVIDVLVEQGSAEDLLRIAPCLRGIGGEFGYGLDPAREIRTRASDL